MNTRLSRAGATLAVLTLCATLSCNASAKAAATTWRLKEGDSLQNALDSAQPGDLIILDAGATFRGPVTLPAKSGDGWIAIQSSALDRLPPDRRVGPADAAAMPKIVSPGGGAVQTEAGAHRYRLLGLEILPETTQAVITALVTLGDGSGAQNRQDQIPHDLVLDRCYIHGLPKSAVRRGVALNSAATHIRNCYIADIKAVEVDAQAICGWNGPGPFHIINNYLEASGENIMFGGADPTVPNLVPSDIQIQGNHFFKPLSWRAGDPSFAGTRWLVKNLFEIKNARRVVVDGNLFENYWADGQTGSAIVLKSVNQEGTAPWSVCQDVQFTNNVVRRAGAGIAILGRDDDGLGQRTKGILIRNNLLEEIDAARWGGSGAFALISNEAHDVTIDHNTVFHSGNILTATGRPTTGLVFTNNLLAHNEYGVKGDGTGIGSETLARYFPKSVFRRNVLVAAPDDLHDHYPPDNCYCPSWEKVGFTEANRDTRRLADESAYWGKGLDGKSIGWNPGYAYPGVRGVIPRSARKAGP